MYVPSTSQTAGWPKIQAEKTLLFLGSHLDVSLYVFQSALESCANLRFPLLAPADAEFVAPAEADMLPENAEVPAVLVAAGVVADVIAFILEDRICSSVGGKDVAEDESDDNDCTRKSVFELVKETESDAPDAPTG